MKKTILASAAALLFAGHAWAQPAPPTAPRDITRAAGIADAEARFAALDANSNGKLEASELQQASEVRRAERRQRMEERVAQMSPEERAEFEQRRAERGAGPGGRAAGREGRQGGGNRAGTGPVSVADFRAQAEQRFDRLDIDRNGVITVAEQAQLHSQRRDRRE